MRTALEDALAADRNTARRKSGQRKGENSAREKVIDAAAHLFRARGYAAVSLRDIAGAAGVTTGSVYHYFGSKDDAVEEVLQLAHRHILLCVKEAVQGLPQSAQPLDRLRAAIVAHILALLGENSLPAATTRIFSQVPRKVRTAALPARHEYEDYWKALLLDCKSQGYINSECNIDLITPLLFGSMNWMLEWYKPSHFSIQSVTDQLILMLR